MTISEAIDAITKLQNAAAKHVSEAGDALRKADELIAEMKERTGSRFVCENKAYMLEHRAIGFMPGNRYFLEQDKSVRIVT